MPGKIVKFASAETDDSIAMSANSRARQAFAAHCDEPRIGEIGIVRLVAFAVGKRLTVDQGAAACGAQHSIACGGVPFHCSAKARIEVGKAARHLAEFQRRADRDDLGLRVLIDESARLGRAM